MRRRNLKGSTVKIFPGLKVIVLLFSLAILALMVGRLGGEYRGYRSAGTHDFLAYWSATRLILERERSSRDEKKGRVS